MAEVAEKTKTPSLAARPPIVVVMGHIDHGKTSLLDAIRKTSVAVKESGGITQGIGAYQAESNGKKITFIDTPGHEAFSAMRGRGAHVADIAVLVIAADEGVKPQTEEALTIIQAAEVPFVVAINKIDKPNADAVRIKNQLAEKSVLVEGFGGNVPVVELSAKTGHGVETLLETILLVAELEELTADPTKPGEGIVIESHLDPKRGATATLLVEDGTLRRGEFIALAGTATPVRIFENFRGGTIDEAGPAEPVRVIGFPKTPPLGERFLAFKSKADAEAYADQPATAPLPGARAANAEDAGKHVVNIILKCDVLGSREAVEEALAKLTSPELSNHIVKSEAGDVNESDVKLAAATTPTFLVAFRVKVPPAMQELAERHGVKIVASDLIYELIDAVRATMLALAPAEVQRVDIGAAKILALFKGDRGKQVVGGRVESGLIRKNGQFDVVRNGLKIGAGKIIELQAQRRAIEEVAAGQEFGILAEADVSIAVGDAINVFAQEKVTPQL